MALTINGEDTNKLTLIQKEGKNISITYNVDITSASFSLVCKDKTGTKFTKEDNDFDKSQVVNKKVIINFSTTDLDLEIGSYEIQIKAVWDAATSVDKTVIIKLKITESLFA